jgi:hypothetical protein
MITYIQEPLEIGRRGSVGRHLNGYTLAAVNEHLRPLRERVTYVTAVDVGVPATSNKEITNIICHSVNHTRFPKEYHLPD